MERRGGEVNAREKGKKVRGGEEVAADGETRVSPAKKAPVYSGYGNT